MSKAQNQKAQDYEEPVAPLVAAQPARPSGSGSAVTVHNHTDASHGGLLATYARMAYAATITAIWTFLSGKLKVSSGTDEDLDVLTVGVTGTPKLGWDESEDSFTLTKGVDVTGDVDATGDVTATGDISATQLQGNPVAADAPNDNDALIWDAIAGAWVPTPPPAGGVVDAADVTYTPAVATDWDGDADPGDADAALDQLAERVDDIEAAGGGGVAADPIWDAAGDLAVGTGANTAGKLAITVPAANILEVLGVVNGETTATWKALHDATAPATMTAGGAGAAGTSLLASHRDHAHPFTALVTADIPAAVAVRYSTNAAQTIVNDAAAAVVDFEDIVYDSDALVTVGAAWHFRAPSTGIYHVHASVSFANTTVWAVGESGILQAFVNGTLYCILDHDDGRVATSNYKKLGGGADISLSAGQDLDIRLFQNSGSNLALLNAGTYNWVSIHRV